jgi:DNA-binding NtrC family response regulator
MEGGGHARGNASGTTALSLREPIMCDGRTDLLLLDDDRDLTDAAALLLESTCSVRVANDVSEARRELQRRRPECLLCDYWLGQVTSIAFLRFVGMYSPCTRRVLMSGCPFDEIRSLLDERLVHSFLAKPLDYETTLRCIQCQCQHINDVEVGR